jgi:16S rRNA (adenine1518-N6/adenine1519-N6)-dimethyltransferase
MVKRKKSGNSIHWKNRRPRHGNGPVRPKKYLGQHFLKDESIAEQIAATLSLEGYRNVIEIGPGTGVLTKHLLDRDLDLVAMELDEESVVYLNRGFPLENPETLQRKGTFKVVEADFLTYDLTSLFGSKPFAITGNFPFNISTQIVFKLLEIRDQVPEFSGMFQKEVAQRICAREGNKTYGILSVLTQAYYNTEYLFTVPPNVFVPPPKVESGVIRLIRKLNFVLDCDEKLFFKVVKTAFNQRRKTLRNSLKTFELSPDLKGDPVFDRRPEQLPVADFVLLTQKIKRDA